MQQTIDPQPPPHDLNPEQQRRRTLLRLLAAIASPALFIFAGVTFYHGDRLLAGLNLTAGILVTAALIHLHRNQQSV